MTNDIPKNIGEFLEYDETSSTKLRWKRKSALSVNIGDEAGSLNNNGYYQTKFNGKKYLNHRIIYFLQHGYCPNIIDHIDGNRQNNNINNLREATSAKNNHNRKINKNNKTGVKGLSIYKETYWQLRIKKNGKYVFSKYHLKTEKTKDECRILLENKRKELHGQFSNNG